MTDRFSATKVRASHAKKACSKCATMNSSMASREMVAVSPIMTYTQ